MVFENRDHRKSQNPIARRKLTFTTLVSESAKDVTIPINGELLNYVINAPNLSTDANYDLVMTNEDAEEIYKNETISDNGSTLVLLAATPVPMAGTITFTISFSTAQVATFNMYLYYR